MGQMQPLVTAVASSVKQATPVSVTGGDEGAAVGGDPDFANVSMLLHFDGDFADVAVPSRVVSKLNSSGFVASETGFGQALELFDGGIGKVTTPATVDLQLGSGEYTLEAMINQTSRPVEGKVLGVWSDTSGLGFSYKVSVTTTGAIQLGTSTTGGNFFFVATAAGVVPLNTLVHVVVERWGATTYIYANGIEVYSGAATGTIYQTPFDKLFEMGGDGAGNTAWFYGTIDEVRVTKGVARYKGAFTPPTAPFPDS